MTPLRDIVAVISHDLMKYIRPVPRLLTLVPIWFFSGVALYYALEIAATCPIPRTEESVSTSQIRLGWTAVFLLLHFFMVLLPACRTQNWGHSAIIWVFAYTVRLLLLLCGSVLL